MEDLALEIVGMEIQAVEWQYTAICQLRKIVIISRDMKPTFLMSIPLLAPQPVLGES